MIDFIKTNYTEKIAVMGSSLGGITSLYVASSDSHVDAVICHNAAIFNEKAYKHIVQVKGVLKLLLPLVPTLAKFIPFLRINVFDYLPAEKLVNTPEGFKMYELFGKDPILANKYTLTSLRAQMRDSPEKPIEKILIPIMFINGDQDGLFSVNYIKSIYQRITSHTKELVIIPACAHLIFQENTEEAINSIVPFLYKHLE